MTDRTAIDLFCGCGGLTLGLKQAGYQVVWAIDSDNHAARTYRANHPDVALYVGDIRTVDPEYVQERLSLETGALDVLAGCAPCQGFSRLRTMNGSKSVADASNDLVLEFERFVNALLPKVILMENVPALADDDRFDRLAMQLGLLGYNVKHKVLNAAHFQVPQRRRRLLVVASRMGDPPFAAPSGARKTVRDALEQLPRPGDSGDPLHDLPERRTDRVRALIESIPKDGGSRADLGPGRQLKCHQDFDGFKDIYGRMAWDAPSPTITGGCYNPSKGRFLHPEQDRAITLREAALLQGFPADYTITLDGGKERAALMIGNALPPAFIRFHALEVARHLDECGLSDG